MFSISTKPTEKIASKKIRLGYLNLERDSESLTKCFTHHVRFSPDSIVTLKQCYDSYKRFVTEELGRVRLTKKTFAFLLKTHLAEDLAMTQVRIIARAGVAIYGFHLEQGKRRDQQSLEKSLC